MAIVVRQVNYSDPRDAEAFIELLNAYSLEPFGAEVPLSEYVKDNLSARLASFPGAYSFISWLDDQPVGLLNSFTGFSTFAARPLINIHDVYVRPEARGMGVVQALFSAVESKALELGCCKLTLEVLEGNTRAQAAYAKLGYQGYDLGDTGGTAQFWQKKL